MDINEFVDQYRTVVFQKYAQFSGRAGRKEFWMFVLVNFVISLLLSLLRLPALSMLYSLAVFVPSLAVGVRRLHDINKSGWWLLIGLVPLVGTIALIVLAAREGTGGPNRFGGVTRPAYAESSESPSESMEA